MSLSDVRPPAYEVLKSPKEEVHAVHNRNDTEQSIPIKSPKSLYADFYSKGYVIIG
jgi:hypothetical protein